jgi:hypothetical protein
MRKDALQGTPAARVSRIRSCFHKESHKVREADKFASQCAFFQILANPIALLVKLSFDGNQFDLDLSATW